ncbi:TlpA family protein disulfide reductase [Candidatus Leptofilum sp.]|uniref:TlpA family protein disulfide reductase n=1 Tax=Candidatus Leptofilum sp. TaxID=3241576 RepID=UPI003B5CDF61
MFAIFLVACGGADEAIQVQDAVSPIQIIRMSADTAVGNPRIVFGLFDGPDAVADAQSVALSMAEVGEAAAEPIWQGSAENYSDYEVPYWVAHPTIPSPGFWGITAEVVLADGRTVTSQFTIEAKAESEAVSAGEMAPLSLNRTLATEPDIFKLSSGNDPDPAFYQLTVADAVASGKPTVVGFITPGLCETKWCAPVLNSVATVREQVGDAVNFIHIEVYEDFQALTYVPEMAEWGLETEPYIFVLDGDGQVTASLPGPVSPRELSQALDEVLP